MKFLFEPTCYTNIYLVSQGRLYIVHSARYMLSNICSRSKSWDYIIKSYFQIHQISPSISRNALTTFHQIDCFELLQLNWSVFPQLKHETTQDLNQFQTHPSIRTRHTKGEKALLTWCLLLLFTPKIQLDLLWQLEKSHHLPGGGPNYIYNIHSLGVTRIVRDKVVDVARWGTQDLYNTDTSDVNKLQSRPLLS